MCALGIKFIYYFYYLQGGAKKKFQRNKNIVWMKELKDLNT